MRDGFALMDPDTPQVELIAAIEPDLPGNLMNDAKCDGSGLLWGGTVASDETPHAGALYRLDADRSVTRVVDAVSCSNGLGWSLDRRLMYYIDSGEQAIDAFDFDDATGHVANRRRLVEIPTHDGIPDGMAVDAEGYLWVAIWGGGAVRRYTPEGRLDRVLEVPSTQVTSCVFGGDDLGDLYITSAAGGLSEQELARDPHSGSLFVHRPGVNGQPTESYAG
jgi:sugar lactone lactonase YvrE